MADCSMISGHIDRETNYDRIRKKSPQELAALLNELYYDFNLCDICAYKEIYCGELECRNGVQEWLEQEATDEQT